METATTPDAAVANREARTGTAPSAVSDPELDRVLDNLMGMVREGERDRLRARIEAAVAAQARGEADDAARQLRFVQDLDILVHVHGPQFMYSRGIAETLRVGEDIVELAYDLQKALK
jgi:predicted metal-dependent TIM-barrel fold hydrolase